MNIMLLLLIACVCFVGAALISRHEKRLKSGNGGESKANVEAEINSYKNMAVLQTSYPHHRQIYDESIAIIKKTNNPDVLFRCMEEMREETNRFCNFHCVRVAHYVSEHTRKNVFTDLIRLRGSLSECSNKDEAYREIDGLISI